MQPGWWYPGQYVAPQVHPGPGGFPFRPWATQGPYGHGAYYPTRGAYKGGKNDAVRLRDRDHRRPRGKGKGGQPVAQYVGRAARERGADGGGRPRREREERWRRARADKGKAKGKKGDKGKFSPPRAADRHEGRPNLEVNSSTSPERGA
jgi:hypothetical protein